MSASAPGRQVGILGLLGSSWRLLASRSPRQAALIVCLTGASGLFAGAVTYCWKLFFDSVYVMITGHSGMSRLPYAFTLLLVFYIMQHAFRFLARVYQPKFMEDVKYSILEEIHEKVDAIPLEYYENPSLYDTMHRASDIVSSGRFLRFFLNGITAFQEAVTSVSVSLVLASFSPWLILLCILSVSPSFVARIVRGTRYYYLKTYETPRIRIRDYLWSLLISRDSLKEARAFGFGDYLKDRWVECSRQLQDEEWTFTRKHGLVQLAVDCAKSLGLGAGIFVLVWLMTEGAIEAGTFGAALAALQTVQTSFNSFLIQLALAGEKVPFVADLFRFLNMKDNRGRGIVKLDQLTRGIELVGVSFAYPGTDRMVLKDINLTIGKGETIALVGLNGAGKTTLVKLILGLYKPTKGEIRYDGVDIRNYDDKSVYQRASAVFQDYVKYHLTLRENIAFGTVGEIHDDGRIMQAIEEVELANVVAKLPQGLDSQLGREFGGAELSGGEWQKVAIARGIINKGDVVVLDEPTASLDPVTESEVYRRFAELARGRTAILISHRVGSARMADRIVVLEDGRIVEEGSHEGLTERRGRYHELFSLQAQWYQ